MATYFGNHYATFFHFSGHADGLESSVVVDALDGDDAFGAAPFALAEGGAAVSDY